MARLTEFTEPFDPYDYLPDNKRDPVLEPLYPLIGLLLNHAMDQGGLSRTIRLPPFLESVMGEYTDKEAVLAYYNTGVNQRMGMLNVVERVFALTDLNLGITEWFNNSFPILPFKFFVDIYEYPTVPLADVIDLIYKIKNERSHLISFRHPSDVICPPYFILDKSLLSSLHFLSSARGDVYRGVKICWYDVHGMITEPILADEFGWMYTNVNLPIGISYIPGINYGAPGAPDDAMLQDTPTALIIASLQSAARNIAPVVNFNQQDAYEVVESYHYRTDEAQYAPTVQDPYGVRYGGYLEDGTTPASSSGGSMRVRTKDKQTWGVYEPSLDYVLDSIQISGRDVIPNEWGLAAADLINELKTNGIWTNLDLLYLLDAPTEELARINLRRYPEHPFVNDLTNEQHPTHKPLWGIYGTGTNPANPLIRSGGNWAVPSYDASVPALGLKATTNNHTIGVWVDEFGPWQTAVVQKDLVGMGGYLRRHTTINNQYQFASQSAAVAALTPTGTTPVLPPAGLFTAGRNSSTTMLAGINGQTSAPAQTSAALAGNFKVLGQEDEWSGNVISLAFAGAYLNATSIGQLATSCKKYRNRIASLLYAA